MHTQELHIVSEAGSRSELFITSEEKATNSKKPKILLVEDDPICQLAAKFILKDCGYEDIIIADTGKQALELFSQEYDLVILDIDLPDLKGTDVCKHIRKKETNRHIPIIAYTASSHNIKEDCIKAGMNGYLNKSASEGELKYLVQYFLPKSNLSVRVS